MSLRVAVLYGGNSSERNVSLVSGEACASALQRKNYDVFKMDPQAGIFEFFRMMDKINPNVIFNALHGFQGEDGKIQGALDLTGIPYTHSGVLASALAMNKPMAKQIFESHGLACPKGKLVKAGDLLKEPPFSGVFVVKPPNEGSSFGVQIIHDSSQLNNIQTKWNYGDIVLVEEYIPGKELTVAVRGNTESAEALGVLEICPNSDFYDYDSKYELGGSVHICPAQISQSKYIEAMNIAVSAHKALGCTGITRTDLRFNDTEGDDGKLYILEINTQPGMTPTSLVPEIAAACGISFDDLVEWMVRDACTQR